jgi:hypothetical protein
VDGHHEFSFAQGDEAPAIAFARRHEQVAQPGLGDEC